MQKIDEALKRSARSRTPTACLQCQRRKQKCSREQPCRHCSRRYPPVECIYTFEGRHRMMPPTSPNRLSVPDDTPAYFYTEPKSRLSFMPSSHGFSNTIQNIAFHDDLKQNQSQGNVGYMTTFSPTTSESFESKSPSLTVSSSTIPSPGTGSFPDPEMDTNELDFSPLPQVSTNMPSGIPEYDYLGAPNLEGEGWNPNPNLSPTGMVNFQNFDQSYFVPVPMQNESSQSFSASGAQTFHSVIGNDGMTNFGGVSDMSYSSETLDNQNRNRGYGVTDEYSRTFISRSGSRKLGCSIGDFSSSSSAKFGGTKHDALP